MKAITSRLRILLGRLRRDHVHAVVRTGDGSAAFGVLGSRHVAAHFSRLVSGGRGHRLCPGFHLGDGSRFVREATRRHGFTVISEVDPPAGLEHDSLRVPVWVAMNTSIEDYPDGFAARLPRSARSDLSKVRKGGFTHEVTTDPAWAAEFHQRFHEPSVRGRHGEEGFVLGAADIEAILANRRGEILKVLRGDRCEAALLAHHEDESYRFARLGWRDNDPQLVKDGVLGALYWLAFARARELGVSEIRFGGTPPYLEDGLLHFKAKWGGRLSRKDSIYGERRLHLNPAHPTCRRMLAERSFIAFGPGDSFVVFSARNPEEVKPPASLLEQLSAWYLLRETPAPWSVDPGLPAGLAPWFENVLARPPVQAPRAPASASL